MGMGLALVRIIDTIIIIIIIIRITVQDSKRA